jgi:TRAP-type C4-dicarboxylate transport system permease small subunit
MSAEPAAGTTTALVRLSNRFRQAAAFVSAMLFGAIVVIFGANIAGRYLFARPIIWADELVVVLLLWSTFITAAFVTREREQVIFDLVYDRCGPHGRRRMLLAGAFALIAIFGAALPGILSYTAFLWRERTSVLEWRLDYVYACFAMFVVALLIRRVALVVGLLRPGWQATIGELEGRDSPGAGEGAR